MCTSEILGRKYVHGRKVVYPKHLMWGMSSGVRNWLMTELLDFNLISLPLEDKYVGIF